MKRYWKLALLVGLVLNSCAWLNRPALAPTATPPPTATAEPGQMEALPPRATLPPTPTQTLTPTPLTPTPTPTPLPPALQGTPYFQPAEIIAAENAAQLARLARWGRGNINQTALSPDGATLAAATDLGIYLFAADSLEQQRFIPTDISLECIAFSPDGLTLATGSNDGILLWDLASGQATLELAGDPHDFVNALAFSPDGSLLASATFMSPQRFAFENEDVDTIDIWDPLSGELLQSLVGMVNYTSDALAFSLDGKYLAAGQTNSDLNNRLGLIVVWDVGTWGEVGRCVEKVRAVYPGSLAFSPDGETLAFPANEVGIILWNTASDAMISIPSFEAGWVYSLAFSRDGKLLAAGTQEGEIVLWDVALNQPVHTLHAEGGAVDSLIFSSDGQLLFSSAEIGLSVWDVGAGILVGSNLAHTPPGAVISFSPDGSRLATYTADLVTIWDAASGQPLQQFSGGEYAVISPDWSLLAAVSVEDRGILLLYDLNSGQLLRQISNDSNLAEISGMAFSPDGGVLAQVEYSFRQILLLWDTATGALLHTIQGENPFSDVLAISPDGQTLATVSYYLDDPPDNPNGKAIHFWDLASGAELEALRLGAGNIRALAYSPDGSLLAVQTFGEIILWEVGSRAVLHTLEYKINGSLAFSPDGRLLAAGGWSSDPLLTLWDVAAGVQVASLAGHNLDTTGLAFSPDGRRLVSTAAEGAILVWGLRP
ncbi:MAG: WD40 repeat domain-containing protein [Anaerolineales bacterium]|nr:WD40 repeat domain-containing protein [Anaerolineales bacterium]